jgi:putative N6-adenine-specific DNA methylase
MSAFAVVAPGLEPVLQRELTALGLRPAPRPGGAAVRLSMRELYLVNLGLRTGTRVLVRVGTPKTRTTTFAELQGAIAAIDWSRWLAPEAPVDVRVASHGSRLFHTGAVAERVLGVLVRPGDPDGQRVQVRLQHDELTVSIDASGAPLHRRGWRLAPAKAPLRETLAAAMVLSSGWDGRAPLCDPLCGSGTIAIEAALIAADRAPGLDRPFAFQRWPCFEPGTWASALASTRARIRPIDGLTILAGDRDGGAIEAARANATRADVTDAITIGQTSISDLPAALAAARRTPGGDAPWIVTNPPYGRRVRATSTADRRDLFARIGQVATAIGADRQVGLLVDHDAPLRATGLDLTERWRTSNGGIPVHFATTPGSAP